MTKNNKLQLATHINIILVLFSITLLFYILIVASNILIPLAFSFILSLFLYPFVKK